MAEGTTPKRIQLRRTKGWRKPEDAIVVSRPSRWGNPFTLDNVYLSVGGSMLGEVGYYDAHNPLGLDMNAPFDITLAHTVLLFRKELAWSLAQPDHDEIRAALRELSGHDLACWRPLDQPCHADVLLEFANKRGGADRAED